VDLGREITLNVERDNPASAPFNPEISSAPSGESSALQQFIDDLPEQVALLDEKCVIIAANRAWKKTVEEHGYFESMPGHSYRDVCAAKAAEGYAPAIEAVAALDDISAGKRSFWQLSYNGGERWDGRDYQISVHRIGVGAATIISVTRFDLTEIFELRRAKASFAHWLSEGQALERQRMARELHDSTAQLLSGATLILSRLKLEPGCERTQAMVEELQALVREALQEIRLVTYLAHLPALEKMSLAEALGSVIEGFGRRTNLQVELEICGEATSFMADESVLYRVAQEALSNVHRHARATAVRATLCFRRCATHLVITDNGVGISREAIAGSSGAGVGLASMRSRLAEIGGRLTARTLSPGTAIIASIPNRGSLRPNAANSDERAIEPA
jgi:signal transduction histidine kinase